MPELLSKSAAITLSERVMIAAGVVLVLAGVVAGLGPRQAPQGPPAVAEGVLPSPEDATGQPAYGFAYVIASGVEQPLRCETHCSPLERQPVPAAEK